MIWDADDEQEPPFEDAMDWAFLSAWRLGRVWERLRTEQFVKAVLPACSAEMALRIAEARGLAFSGQYLSERFMLVTFGTQVAQDA